MFSSAEVYGLGCLRNTTGCGRPQSAQTIGPEGFCTHVVPRSREVGQMQRDTGRSLSSGKSKFAALALDGESFDIGTVIVSPRKCTIATFADDRDTQPLGHFVHLGEDDNLLPRDRFYPPLRGRHHAFWSPDSH